MTFTTHEKIRVESGFQSRFLHDTFGNTPNSSITEFFLRTDDYERVVPEFGLGGTIAGVSDVQVFVGASGVQGLSRMNVSSIDLELGSVTVDTAPDTGASITVTYSSSPIPSRDIEEVRKRAESIINQRLSLCYNLPLSPVPSHITRLATELAGAFLLMRGYGTSSRDTAADGYRKYEQLMGNNEFRSGNAYTDADVLTVGEIGLVCTPNYQLIDDDGNIIGRNDADSSEGSNSFVAGGRISGRLYDITEEEFRYKDFQRDVDRRQAGSGVRDVVTDSPQTS